MLSEPLREDLQSIISELPIPMECGRKCNDLLPYHGGKDLTYKKGSIVGGLVGGPFGYMYGSQLPLNSLHSLCRAKCKADKKRARGENISSDMIEIKNKLQKARSYSSKVKNPQMMNSLIQRIMSHKF